MIVASHASEMQLSDSLSYFSKPAPARKVDDEWIFCVWGKIFCDFLKRPNDY